MSAKELADIRKKSKEERLEYYFRSLAEGIHVDREYLNLTEEDERDYQLLKEKEVSMKPTKKRDILVKQMLKPLLKEKGFKASGPSWWKELEDCWLFFHMKNSRWNGMVVGANFSFLISVSGKDEMKHKMSEQWIYNQSKDLEQSDFLPYRGYITPHMSGGMYKIDGYRNFLPSDEPIDEIIEQVRGDLENYIFPELEKLKTKADWDILYQKKYEERYALETSLMRYYFFARDGQSESFLLLIQKELGLTAEEITSHFDLLELLQRDAVRSYQDAKNVILQSLRTGQ